MEKLSGSKIGGSPKSIEDEVLLKGQARFIADVHMQETSYASFLRSDHAHARIKSVDCETARSMPGVFLILTGKDCREENLGSIIPFAFHKRKDGTDMFVPENLPLADSKVVFVGDPIAVVIAKTKNEAELACEAISVDYEELEHTTDISKALSSDSALVWPESATNECFFWSKGDLDKVKKYEVSADYLVKQNFIIPLATANPIEPRGCVAEYDPKSDHYVLTASVQSPWKVRQILAVQSLGVSENNISVVCPDIGGSFGMKGQTYNEYAICLWAAKKVNRPVKWIASRSESFLSDDQGRNIIAEAAISLSKDGKFLGLNVSVLCGLGAYLSTRGTKTAVDNWPGVSGVYQFEAVYSEVRGVFTNTPPISPYRGAGRPEASYVIERLVDLAAQKTQMCRIEIREKNFIKAASMPFTNNLGFKYDSGDYHTSLTKALELSEWYQFENRKAKSKKNGLLRGRGVACVVERSMSGQPEYASVEINKVGEVTLACGAVSFGQGSSTIFRQIFREIIDLEDIDIKYVSGDTRKIKKGTGSFGSRSAGLAGAAVALAAKKVIHEGSLRAAHFLQDNHENIQYAEGVFRGSQGGSIHLLELVQKKEIFVEAKYETDNATFPSGTHISEVEVDPETGKVSLLRYVAVEDTGTVINPARLDGQMHGGVAQGAGQALMERVCYDPDSGQLLTGSFMDYAMPRALDMPFFEVEHYQTPSPNNPLGIKGGGEGGTVGGLVCVANAIADSVSIKTKREVPIPATPFALWQILNSGD